MFLKNTSIPEATATFLFISWVIIVDMNASYKRVRLVLSWSIKYQEDSIAGKWESLCVIEPLGHEQFNYLPPPQKKKKKNLGTVGKFPAKKIIDS